MKQSLVFDTLLKALGSSILGASGSSFLEQRLVIEPMRLSAVVFSLRVLCLCGLKTYPNALSAYSLWTKGDVAKVFEDYREVQTEVYETDSDV